jgi:hypothetical protein
MANTVTIGPSVLPTAWDTSHLKKMETYRDLISGDVNYYYYCNN